MEQRAKIGSIVQSEPYYIAEVSLLDDEVVPPSATEALLRAEIGARFEALWNAVKRDNMPVPIPLDSLSFSQLSFQILGFLQTDPVLAQILLEETHPGGLTPHLFVSLVDFERVFPAVAALNLCLSFHLSLPSSH